jgi:hypothetical protein
MKSLKFSSLKIIHDLYELKCFFESFAIFCNDQIFMIPFSKMEKKIMHMTHHQLNNTLKCYVTVHSIRTH